MLSVPVYAAYKLPDSVSDEAGVGADVALDCVGNEGSLDAALETTRKGGRDRPASEQARRTAGAWGSAP